MIDGAGKAAAEDEGRGWGGIWLLDARLLSGLVSALLAGRVLNNTINREKVQ